MRQISRQDQGLTFPCSISSTYAKYCKSVLLVLMAALRWFSITDLSHSLFQTLRTWVRCLFDSPRSSLNKCALRILLRLKRTAQ